MINGIGKGGSGRIEANRSAPGQGVSAEVHARNDARKLGQVTSAQVQEDVNSSKDRGNRFTPCSRSDSSSRGSRAPARSAAP